MTGLGLRVTIATKLQCIDTGVEVPLQFVVKLPYQLKDMPQQHFVCPKKVDDCINLLASSSQFYMVFIRNEGIPMLPGIG